ncbi:MAG: hypothetical protein EAZ42_10560 [Verrucomicrobia bacterium]|nr:MAG: hypothetical protein EAZ42_10560 [Verrucomicrobiota bacterium]
MKPRPSGRGFLFHQLDILDNPYFMKPRITLAETTLADNSTLSLLEHDGRHALQLHGQQICGPATISAETEMARLACAPFRPVRQPKVVLVGLGLGHALASVSRELLQKKATITVLEPVLPLVEWHREFLTDSPIIKDPRVVLENDDSPRSLSSRSGTVHAILIHLDVALPGPRNRPWIDDKAWLSAAYEALQAGGLLAITSTLPVANLTRRLLRTGWEVAEYSVPSSPNAKRPRFSPIWLARKGARGKQE